MYHKMKKQRDICQTKEQDKFPKTNINEMEKNAQESLLLSEIIFTSVLPLAITVSSPEFRDSEFFLHQIKSKKQ